MTKKAIFWPDGYPSDEKITITVADDATIEDARRAMMESFGRKSQSAAFGHFEQVHKLVTEVFDPAYVREMSKGG